MPGQMRQGQHAPIVPPRDGTPPGWIVVCLDCPFSHDTHGETASDAVQAVAPTHARTHRLIARPAAYTEHPLYH